jgi:hypothetical protein
MQKNCLILIYSREERRPGETAGTLVRCFEKNFLAARVKKTHYMFVNTISILSSGLSKGHLVSHVKFDSSDVSPQKRDKSRRYGPCSCMPRVKPTRSACTWGRREAKSCSPGGIKSATSGHRHTASQRNIESHATT